MDITLYINLLTRNRRYYSRKARLRMPALTQKMTVPEAVRQILTKNYPIYQCLKMKLTNFHSVAELIQPHVQQLTGRKPTINTLVVAIKRFSDTLDELKSLDPVRALENTRISLSNGIADVTVRAPRAEFPKILNELSEMSAGLTEFPTSSHLQTRSRSYYHQRITSSSGRNSAISTLSLFNRTWQSSHCTCPQTPGTHPE